MAEEISVSAWRAATDAMPWYRDDDGTRPTIVQCEAQTPSEMLHFLRDQYTENGSVEVVLAKPDIAKSAVWPTDVSRDVMQYAHNGATVQCTAKQVSFMLAALRKYPAVCSKITMLVNQDPDYVKTGDPAFLDLVYWLVRTYETLLKFGKSDPTLGTYVVSWCKVIRTYETALPLVRYLVAQRAATTSLSVTKLFDSVQYFRRHLARPDTTLSRRRFKWIGHVLKTPGNMPTATWLPLFELNRCTDRFDKCKMVVPDKPGYKHVHFGTDIRKEFKGILTAMDDIVTP
jgi:hypothetical protein